MKPRLLILTTRYPLPIFGGDTLRIINIAKYLSQYYDVTLVCIDNGVKRDLPLERQLPFTVLVFKQTNFDRLNGVINLLLLRRTLQNAYYECREYTNFVKESDFESTKFLVHLTRSIHFLPKEQCNQNVLEMTDATSYSFRKKFFKKFLANPSLALAQFLDSFGTRNVEKTAIELFKNVVLVSERDATYFKTDVIKVIENGVQFCDRAVLGEPRRNSIVFVGNLTSLSNWSGLQSFVYGDFRNLRKLVPTLELHVVGTVPVSVKRKLQEIDGIMIHGNVSNLHDFISQFEIGICPIYFAGGMQNKVLDYLSAGIEAVVTRETYNGLPHDLQTYVKVYDNSHELINFVLHSSKRCLDERQKIVDYMENTYGWTARLIGYEKLW